MRYNLLGGCLILVGRYCQGVTCCFQCLQQFWNTIVGTREVAVVRIVVGHEMFAQAEHSGFVAMLLRQRALNKAVDAITHKARVVLNPVCRKTTNGQGMVACLSQVINRVDECAV